MCTVQEPCGLLVGGIGDGLTPDRPFGILKGRGESWGESIFERNGCLFTEENFGQMDGQAGILELMCTGEPFKK